MTSPTPILLLSDSPSGQTGLGRITREIALRIHEHLGDRFRVGTYGHGAPSDPGLPFQQFTIPFKDLQGVPDLPGVWTRFAGARNAPGIIFSITNASWVPWLAQPETIADEPKSADLKQWLLEMRDSGVLKRWLYFPVDAEGPNGRLHPSQADIILGFDRALTYGDWGARVVDATLEGHPKRSGRSTDYLPHGTEAVFAERNRRSARYTFLHRLQYNYCTPSRPSGTIGTDCLLLGVVATNTARKDWPLAFQVLKELVARGHDAYLWAHVDRMQWNWDLSVLANEFEVADRVVFTSGNINDVQLAWLYSALDVTLCIGAGEGWGLSGSESLACRTPVVHGNYAGQPEFTPSWMLVDPAMFTYDGFHANLRPIFRAEDWADKVLEVKGKEFRLEERFMWDGPRGCWERWSEWLLAGLEDSPCES